MSEFLPCSIALGRRRYVGMWREIDEWTLVYMGESWDCAPTLRQPPRRVAEMLVKRMVEKGAARIIAPALAQVAPFVPIAGAAEAELVGA